MLTAAVVLLTGCSIIDDDLSNCGSGYQLGYELQLVTNLSTELQTQLTTQTELSVAAALRSRLSNIFTDHAHDVDLSFYDVDGDSLRLQHDQHIMDNKQANYTLNLPKRHYMHLAVANVANNPVVSLANDELCHTAVLRQQSTDTISSHSTGVFTARQQMDVQEGVDQQFNVHLYMANCAATLVIDPRGKDLKDLRVFSTGFASQFNIADSIFTFSQQDPIVRTIRVDNESNDEMSFTSVSFPSRDLPDTRSIIEGEEPFISQNAEDALWQFRVYNTASDGSTTETLLGIHKPLRPGQLMVLKVYVNDEGIICSDDLEIGISITPHWNQGIEYNHEL